jgi:beta-phosphoglucomutase-like phosphatase (HAD superfamily)
MESLVSAIKSITGIDTTGLPEISEKSMISSAGKIKKVQAIYKFDDNTCDSILALKDALFFEMIKNIEIPRNVLECLMYIKAMGIKSAIASNSRLINMNRILDITNIRQYFDTIVSSEDVINRKPAPDMLFEIYKRLGVDGKDTLFIDDTDEGAAAGYNSQSDVIKISCPQDLTIGLLNTWINKCT